MIGSHHPLGITNHARERLAERLNITDKEAQEIIMRQAFHSGQEVPDEIKHCFLRVSGSTSFRFYRDAVFIFRGANRHNLITVVTMEDIKTKKERRSV